MVKLHDACSELGSHADVSSFFHRYDVINNPEKNGIEVQIGYFQFPKQNDECKFYFTLTLQAFYSMIMIFRDYFKEKYKIIVPGEEDKLIKIGITLQKLNSKYYGGIKNKLDQETKSKIDLLLKGVLIPN